MLHEQCEARQHQCLAIPMTLKRCSLLATVRMAGSFYHISPCPYRISDALRLAATESEEEVADPCPLASVRVPRAQICMNKHVRQERA